MSHNSIVFLNLTTKGRKKVNILFLTLVNVKSLEEKNNRTNITKFIDNNFPNNEFNQKDENPDDYKYTQFVLKSTFKEPLMKTEDSFSLKLRM